MQKEHHTSKIIHFAIIVWLCIWVEGKKNKRSRTCSGHQEVLYLEENVCFRFHNAKKSWADANRMCVENGGSLAIVESQNISDFITQEFSTFPGSGHAKDYWIGLSRNSTSTNFYWSTGSSLDWENWEYAPASSGAKCVSASVALGHQWQEDGCKTKKSFMCQLPATVAVETTTVSVLATWTQWGACSTTCGHGTRSRFKSCSQVTSATCNPVNQHEGCQEQSCTVIADDVWSTWGNWSSCSVTCGHGTKTRLRTCQTGQIAGGAMCPGTSTDSKGCQESSCNAKGPTASSWSDWSEWSACSVTCNRGTKTRVRTCSGSSTGRGKNAGCKGKDTKHRVCGKERCTDMKKKKKVAGIFQSRSKDLGIHGFEISRMETNSLMSCAMSCVQDDLCRSFNYQYRADDKLHQCALNSVDKYDNPQAVTAMKDYTLYDIESLFASD